MASVSHPLVVVKEEQVNDTVYSSGIDVGTQTGDNISLFEDNPCVDLVLGQQDSELSKILKIFWNPRK
jgi:hypothetical protein